MLGQLYTITRNTFLESLRQPIVLVITIVGSVLIWLNLSIAAYTFDDDNKILIDCGLGTLALAGLLVAGFCATGVLSAEIENRTVLTVVSKPVSRVVFVLGKFLGVALAVTLVYWLLGMEFLMTVRHRVMSTASDPFDGPVILFSSLAGLIALIVASWGNYFFQWVFTSRAVVLLAIGQTLALGLVLVIDKQWQFQSPLTDIDPQLMIALVLVLEGLMILSAVGITASTRLGQVMTLVILVGVGALGLVSEVMFGRFLQESILARFCYWVVPNIQYFWLADALTQGHPITVGHMLWVSGYAALFLLAVLSLAVALFQTRELG